MYDTLIVQSGDELGGCYGRLAEGIAVTEDRRTLVFRLRPEARFHDGSPVTARDVKFTLDWAAATVDGSLVFAWIDTVEAVDDREVRVHLNEPLKDSHLRFLSFGPRVLPEHRWRGRHRRSVQANSMMQLQASTDVLVVFGRPSDSACVVVSRFHPPASRSA